MGPLRPRPPTFPWAHPSGLSLQGGAIQTGSGEAAGIIPTPQAGGLGWGKACSPLPRASISPGYLWTQGSEVGEGAPTSEAAGCGVGWLLIWVLLCDSGRVALPLWASLPPTDKILSELPENCDPAHLPQERARPPWGCPSRCPLLLQVPGPRWAEGTGSLSCPLPLLDPQALPQICRHPHPVHCLQVTDE